MKLLKLCKYFYYLKTHFYRLPKGIQSEIVENMEEYCKLARLAKSIDICKEVIL